jgi:hypothetical protein
VLSLSALRVLARIEVEYCTHGGNDNGRLPVTYDQFEAYGIHRHSISPAFREVEILGFMEVTERGSAGNREFRKPNVFRLTYLPVGRAEPTHEWRRFETMEHAEQAIEAVRPTRPRKQNSSDGFRQVSVMNSVTEKETLSVMDSALNPVMDSVTTSISRAPARSGGRAAPLSPRLSIVAGSTTADPDGDPYAA